MISEASLGEYAVEPTRLHYSAALRLAMLRQKLE
jgi:hypothetical protein